MPLEDFGTHIPPTTAELNWLGQDEKPVRRYQSLLRTPAMDVDPVALGWDRWRAHHANTDNGITRVRLDTMTEELSVSVGRQMRR